MKKVYIGLSLLMMLNFSCTNSNKSNNCSENQEEYEGLAYEDEDISTEGLPILWNEISQPLSILDEFGFQNSFQEIMDKIQSPESYNEKDAFNNAIQFIKEKKYYKVPYQVYSIRGEHLKIKTKRGPYNLEHISCVRYKGRKELAFIEVRMDLENGNDSEHCNKILLKKLNQKYGEVCREYRVREPHSSMILNENKEYTLKLIYTVPEILPTDYSWFILDGDKRYVISLNYYRLAGGGDITMHYINIDELVYLRNYAQEIYNKERDEETKSLDEIDL